MSRNARLSRPVIRYAQCQITPLVIAQRSSFVPPLPPVEDGVKSSTKLFGGEGGPYRPLVLETNPKRRTKSKRTATGMETPSGKVVSF